MRNKRKSARKVEPDDVKTLESNIAFIVFAVKMIAFLGTFVGAVVSVCLLYFSYYRADGKEIHKIVLKRNETDNEEILEGDRSYIYSLLDKSNDDYHRISGDDDNDFFVGRGIHHVRKDIAALLIDFLPFILTSLISFFFWMSSDYCIRILITKMMFRAKEFEEKKIKGIFVDRKEMITLRPFFVYYKCISICNHWAQKLIDISMDMCNLFCCLCTLMIPDGEENSKNIFFDFSDLSEKKPFTEKILDKVRIVGSSSESTSSERDVSAAANSSQDDHISDGFSDLDFH